MAGTDVVIDIQQNAAFAGSTRETTQAIKAWVMDEINARMVIANRAADFMLNLEAKRV